MPVSPQFELSGGALCLDLANTVEQRATTPRDLLATCSDLVAWGREAGILSDARARKMEHRARRHPREAATVLRRARALREAIYGVFSALAAGRKPAPEDLGVLNREVSRVAADLRLVPHDHQFVWEWAGEDSAPRQVLWPIARSAAELLASGALHRIRECASETCAWLFLDSSKNRSRRWCDMKVCGNRAKVRRFYRRHSAS